MRARPAVAAALARQNEVGLAAVRSVAGQIRVAGPRSAAAGARKPARSAGYRERAGEGERSEEARRAGFADRPGVVKRQCVTVGARYDRRSDGRRAIAALTVRNSLLRVDRHIRRIREASQLVDQGAGLLHLAAAREELAAERSDRALGS